MLVIEPDEVRVAQVDPGFVQVVFFTEIETVEAIITDEMAVELREILVALEAKRGGA